MRLALEQAQCAYKEDEVPVGAVVVLEGEVIGLGYNQNRGLHDPSAHAEIMALRCAAKKMSNHRLTGAKLFVTVEPCVMCAGALLHARIETLVYAAHDERWGAAGSVANILASPLLNHQCKVISGVLADEAAQIMRQFFVDKR